MERAGVTVGAFYRRYPDKNALLRHLDERFFYEVEQKAATLLAPEREFPYRPMAVAEVEPARVAQRVEPDAGRRPLVAIAQRQLREARRHDLIVEVGAESEMGGGGFEDHASTRKLAVGPSPAAQPWGRWRRSRRRGWPHEPAQAATPFVTLARATSPWRGIGEGARLRRPMLLS